MSDIVQPDAPSTVQDTPAVGTSYRRVKLWKAANPEAVKAQKERWLQRNRSRRKVYLASYYINKTAPKLALERADEVV